MFYVPNEASTKQVLDLVRKWIDLLSQEDYIAAAAEVLPVNGDETVNPEYLESDIKSYRSPEYYPGVEDFKVTDWRTAQGGNPDAQQTVVWYKLSSSGLRAAVAFDLPVNGCWSDLTADLVCFEADSPEGSVLCLEGVESWKQLERRLEASEEER